VHEVYNPLESALSFPNTDFSHPFNVVRLGLNERCEDGLDDLGAAGSEIVTLSDQFITSCTVSSSTATPNFSFAIAKTSLKQRTPSAQRFQSV
jgi:hypothetical protein